MGKRSGFDTRVDRVKGKVRIEMIRLEAEIDSDNPEVQRACQKIIDNAVERIEAVVAEAVCKELKLLIPGITAECTGTWMEDEE